MNELQRDSQPSIATLKLANPLREGAWTLEIQDPNGNVRRVIVGRDPIVVGSGPGAGVVIEDRAVSKRHCELIVRDGALLVRDLGSCNGTYVGGARIQVAQAGGGSVITVGQSTMLCLLVGPSNHEEEARDAAPLPGVAGRSLAMRRIAAQVRRLARMNAPVLIAGETGTGKELIARALHAEGPRVAAPFVAINVAALPRELVESELFGHERGAFTGAVSRRAGAFCDADNGTLFLDEIGEIPVDAQPKLLRALDGYEVRRVGASGGGRRADVRLVAATHVNLHARMMGGMFRRDLFHRLEVFIIDLPALRDRSQDIPSIARLLLKQLEPQIGVRDVTPSAIAQLIEHDWPGNVRELRNVLVRAADFAPPTRWLDHVAIHRAMGNVQARRAGAVTPETARELLERHHGNVSAAARALALPRTTFRKLLGSAA